MDVNKIMIVAIMDIIKILIVTFNEVTIDVNNIIIVIIIEAL